MPELGRLAVCLALVCAVFSIAASIRGGLTRRADVIRSGEHPMDLPIVVGRVPDLSNSATASEKMATRSATSASCQR